MVKKSYMTPCYVMLTKNGEIDFEISAANCAHATQLQLVSYVKKNWDVFVKIAQIWDTEALLHVVLIQSPPPGSAGSNLVRTLVV